MVALARSGPAGAASAIGAEPRQRPGRAPL